jgi:hypothetical protein
MLLFLPGRDTTNPPRVSKDEMKRTKRLAIEVLQREVGMTVTVTAGWPQEDVQRKRASLEAVSDVCGSPWITVALQGTEEAVAGAENIHRALEQAGVHLQVSATGQLKICRKSLEDTREKV